MSPGYKIIRHAPSGINEPDDPALPFKVEASLSPPDLMQVTFICRYGGSEEVVACCADIAAVERFVRAAKLRGHPRLSWIKMTGPDGVTVDITTERAGRE